MEGIPYSAMPSKRLRLANAIGYGALLVVNGLSQSGLFGDDNGTISAQYPTPLTPAAWAFSIWGIIFLLQGVGAVYQWLPHGYESNGWKSRMINTIGYSWVAGWTFEMLWQFFFQLQSPVGMWICLALILAAFAAFGRALLRLYGLKHQFGPMSSVMLFTAYWLPTSINTAWLSVASSVAALVVPSAYHTSAGTDIIAVTLAALFTVIGATAVLKEKDVFYGLTLVWSLAAVFGGQDVVIVRVAALVCIVLLLGVSLVSVLRPHTNSASALELNEDSRQSLVAGATGTPRVSTE